jgi:hypothetical protein
MSTKKLTPVTSRIDINNILRRAYISSPAFNFIIDYNVNEVYSLILKSLLEASLNHNLAVDKLYLDIVQLLQEKEIIKYILHDYLLLGEAFVYAELNEKAAQWNDFKIQNPDYIVVKRTLLGDTECVLRPDEFIRKSILEAHKKKEKSIYGLDQLVFDSVVKGENIPLNNFYVSHLANRISAYEPRGTSPFVAYINDFKLDDYSKLEEHVLHPNCKNITEPSDRNNARNMKHLQIKAMIFQFIEKKIFIPIAKLNDFYTYRNGERVLNLPEFCPSRN